MVPADEWLAGAPAKTGDKIPYVLAVDRDDVLRRVIARWWRRRRPARFRSFTQASPGIRANPVSRS
jgi:hypothetical protein